MTFILKSLEYKYSYQLTQFIERSIAKSLTDDLKHKIDNYENVKENLLHYISILDTNGICQPLFEKDTPEFILEFLSRIYANCNNYMFDHPEEII